MCQVGVAHDMRRAAHQRFEQHESGARHGQFLPVTRNFLGHRVEREVGHAHDLPVLQVPAPVQRADTRLEFAHGEWLDQIVVGTFCKSGQLVVERIARGEHQHGRVAAGLAHCTAEVEPVELGQSQIEHDDVVRTVERHAQAGRTIGGMVHDETTELEKVQAVPRRRAGAGLRHPRACAAWAVGSLTNQEPDGVLLKKSLSHRKTGAGAGRPQGSAQATESATTVKTHPTPQSPPVASAIGAPVGKVAAAGTGPVGASMRALRQLPNV
jgi:hypothetical protein